MVNNSKLFLNNF